MCFEFVMPLLLHVDQPKVCYGVGNVCNALGGNVILGVTSVYMEDMI